MVRMTKPCVLGNRHISQTTRKRSRAFSVIEERLGSTSGPKSSLIWVPYRRLDCIVSSTYMYILGANEQGITELEEIYFRAPLFFPLHRTIWLFLFGPSA